MSDNKKPTLFFAVTNDLNQDQRMHRICTALFTAGFNVMLTGRKKTSSQPLYPQQFNQRRLHCIFMNGFLFYAEYNIRLFCFLLIRSWDAVCSIDSDTLPACTLAAMIKRKKLIFDAHEYFTEVPELNNRNFVKNVWKVINKNCIPHCDLCYTVNLSLAKIFEVEYGKKFGYIYNAPSLLTVSKDVTYNKSISDIILLYQGMLNHGRCLDKLIKAMTLMPQCTLWIAGEGDLSHTLRMLVKNMGLENKVRFLGWQSPEVLKKLTAEAAIGINLLESDNLNNYYSLANKFFDYMHAVIPSVNMDFPEYRTIISMYQVGVLVENCTPELIAETISKIIEDPEFYSLMQKDCIAASNKFNWEAESAKLIQMYQELLCH